MTATTVQGNPETSVVRIIANIFISFIGAGVLGLPYAFKVSGLMEGTIIMSFVCYLSIKAMLLIIDCKYMVVDIMSHRNGNPPNKTNSKKTVSNGKEYVEVRTTEPIQVEPEVKTANEITYSDVGYAAFGSTGQITIDTTLLVSQVGFCCAYLIFISENLASFMDNLTQHQWLLVILPPLFFLTLIPDLNNLALFSLLAQISNLFAFAVVFWFDFEHLHLASNEHRKEFSLVGFPFFFSIAIYCFEGAGMILSLEASVSESLKPLFRRYFVLTIVAVTTLYITFGVSGYLSYGEETRDIITLNLITESSIDFAIIVKSCLCFSLFFTYPIMLFPVTSLLEERFLSAKDSKLYPVVMRLILVSLTGVIVVMVPRFADLMALVGATCCTLLAFIMPGLCHLKLLKVEDKPMLNYVLIAVGVLGAILGTFDAISNILKN